MKYIMKLKGLDMFGHRINLKYDKNGEKYNSPQGIFTSIMIQILVIIYTCVRLEVLILKSESNISSVS